LKKKSPKKTKHTEDPARKPSKTGSGDDRARRDGARK